MERRLLSGGRRRCRKSTSSLEVCAVYCMALWYFVVRASRQCRKSGLTTHAVMSWQCASEIKNLILYHPPAEVPSLHGAPVLCKTGRPRYIRDLRPDLLKQQKACHSPRRSRCPEGECNRPDQPGRHAPDDALVALAAFFFSLCCFCLPEALQRLAALPCRDPGPRTQDPGQMGRSARDRPRTCGASKVVDESERRG